MPRLSISLTASRVFGGAESERRRRFEAKRHSTWKPQLDAPEWAAKRCAGNARRRGGLKPTPRAISPSKSAFRVGPPGKSSVGGGALAIAPRKASIAVWAPGLNDAGNSLVGELALERLSRRRGWSAF